jgi:hypothetical protein
MSLRIRWARRQQRPRSRRLSPVGRSLSQIFLGDPQSYKGPVVAYAGGAPALKAAAAQAGIDLYVHAPYPINVASTNNRVRIPGRKLLQQHLHAAAEIGAKGVVVHGGHLGKDEDAAVGFDNWRKCIDGLDLPVPLLIENTAGGDNAMARRLEAIARLWDSIGTASEGGDHGRVLPRHLSRVGRRQRPRRRRRAGAGDHRAYRSRARQRLARHLRLRCGPAHQLRLWARSTAPTSRRRPGRRRTGGLRDARWCRRSGRRHRLAARSRRLTSGALGCVRRPRLVRRHQAARPSTARILVARSASGATASGPLQMPSP